MLIFKQILKEKCFYIDMSSVQLQNLNNIYQTSVVKKKKTAPVEQSSSAEKSQTPIFNAQAYMTGMTIRTVLANKDERKKYEDLSNELELPYRKKLEFALKSGQLLKNNSNDRSTVLDNLHKIITEERDPGLDKVTILKECLDILANPYVITQTCEDIPKEYKRQIIGLITNLSESPSEISKVSWELDNMHTGTCPAASIEFDLATKHTAEFFRMVEGLTSPNHEVAKTIKMDNLSETSNDAIWLLNTFKTPHVVRKFDRADVLLKPDENAIIRARIQNGNRDKGERSIIDVLMQSTFMQLGSQQTYNSLIDKRAPNKWTQEDGGLIDFEKTFVESLVEDKNTTSVTYQKVDDEGRLSGYSKDFATIKKELLDTLKKGHNIIIGYTWPDPENGNRLAGHEITIVGYKINSNGEGVFICQDSDDDISAPITMPEKELLRKIHHAGLPDEIAAKDSNYQNSWEIGINEFQEMLKQSA